jgi:hypothetical protein
LQSHICSLQVSKTFAVLKSLTHLQYTRQHTVMFRYQPAAVGPRGDRIRNLECRDGGTCHTSNSQSPVCGFLKIRLDIIKSPASVVRSAAAFVCKNRDGEREGSGRQERLGFLCLFRTGCKVATCFSRFERGERSGVNTRSLRSALLHTWVCFVTYLGLCRLLRPRKPRIKHQVGFHCRLV